MDGGQRHAAWLKADDGLFTSIQQTKRELAESVDGLDEADSLSSELLGRIARSKQEIQDCGHLLHETSALLQQCNMMVFELTEKIATLHLQISQARLFITQEVNTDSDTIINLIAALCNRSYRTTTRSQWVSALKSF